MTEPQLRRLLDRAAEVPVPPDPWPEIRRRGHRLRRVRLAVAVTGTAAVAAVGISVPRLMVSQPVTSAAPRPSSADIISLAHGTWRSIPAPPSAAIQDAVMVWTGQELVIWGGSGWTAYLPAGGLRAGYAYQPATGRWQSLPAAPISADGTPEGVWTGTDVVVAASYGGHLRLAAYRPATGTWHRLPPPPVAGLSASEYRLIWTGRQLLLYGYPPETSAQAGQPLPARVPAGPRGPDRGRLAVANPDRPAPSAAEHPGSRVHRCLVRLTPAGVHPAHAQRPDG